MKATLPFSNRTQVIASLLVLVGSICFAAKAVLVKLAYHYDIDPISLLALRMVFSLPFFLVIAWNAKRKAIAKNAPPLNRKDWLTIIILGLLGYYFASLFDFRFAIYFCWLGATHFIYLSNDGGHYFFYLLEKAHHPCSILCLIIDLFGNCYGFRRPFNTRL